MNQAHEYRTEPVTNCECVVCAGKRAARIAQNFSPKECQLLEFRMLEFRIQVTLAEKEPVALREAFSARNVVEALQNLCFACGVDPRDITGMTITRVAS